MVWLGSSGHRIFSALLSEKILKPPEAQEAPFQVASDETHCDRFAEYTVLFRPRIFKIKSARIYSEICIMEKLLEV
ncbi:MAG: hypothetical protein CMF59_00445 [Leptospiraceae bacterium]|nr:hypothetical protein [Leptospiraceae bacterium]